MVAGTTVALPNGEHPASALMIPVGKVDRLPTWPSLYTACRRADKRIEHLVAAPTRPLAKVVRNLEVETVLRECDSAVLISLELVFQKAVHSGHWDSRTRSDVSALPY